MKSPSIRKPTSKEKKAYEAITKGKISYGTYHKTCFHLHTPVSYDYRLFSEWDDKQFESATAHDLLQMCIDHQVVINTVTLDDIVLENELNCFENKKELLAYLLLAEKIRLAQIEIILVADHNTIHGVDKLRAAVRWIHNAKRYRVYPTVLLGIEISCADKNHVVAMFDDTPENRSRLNIWLRENLIDFKEGVFVTSLDVLSFIKSANGIGYIAHINTSGILKKDTFSGGFKKRLLDSSLLKYAGLSDINKRDQTEADLRQFRKASINFLPDNDSHDIDSIDKNIFWIKGGKCTYSMVAEALNDYHISVEFSLPTYVKQYIKGLYIEKSDLGFLKGKENDDFCVIFSNALNCLIGGRGTGKSSILEILEYVMNQRCSNERKLDFICSHGTAYKLRNIREVDVVQYMTQLCATLGPIDFFRMVLQQDVATAQKTIPIKKYLTTLSVRMIEMGHQSIEPSQESAFIVELFNRIVSESNMGIIQAYFKKYLLQNDRFELLFNVNNREGTNGQQRFMNVRDLSLGQKVVAMLTFVLGYSDYAEDYRPLIIDQPEDNLDNQYIYKNLVKQLRDIKEKRQVIIATHNATIVTNAKADLVCEMQSDNIHGWIESMGYPSEERIKKKILNHLEGGIDSFVHKTDIYHNVLSKMSE